MEVLRKEMIRIRMYLLRQMDTFIRENIREDVVIDLWFAYGLEDGWDEDILVEYASDDKLWNDCINVFCKCCKIEGILKYDDEFWNNCISMFHKCHEIEKILK